MDGRKGKGIKLNPKAFLKTFIHCQNYNGGSLICPTF